MVARHRLLVTLIAATALTAACHRGEEPEAAPVVTVDVAPVLSASIQQTIRAEGLIYPIQQAAMVPKIAAPVKKVYVEKGARVKAGQLLVELENQDLASAAREAQAAYDQAEATYETTSGATVPEDVQKAELDVRATKDTLDAQQAVFDSRQQLFREGAIAQKDVNEAQVALTQARNANDIAQRHLANLQRGGTSQALKAATAQRDQAKARLDAAQAQLGYSRITSPIDGVVTDRPLFAGETAANGPVVTVMDPSQVIARAHIPQTQTGALKVGNAASIIAPDGAPIPGTITEISPAVDAQGTTVEIWVQAANPDGKLRPGASARVELIAKTVDSALVIPENAIITSPSGSTSVVIVDGENKPHKKSVMVGVRDSGKAEITDGLDTGQRVVTTGAFELAKLDADVLAKTSVKIAPPKEEDDDDEP